MGLCCFVLFPVVQHSFVLCWLGYSTALWLQNWHNGFKMITHYNTANCCVKLCSISLDGGCSSKLCTWSKDMLTLVYQHFHLDYIFVLRDPVNWYSLLLNWTARHIEGILLVQPYSSQNNHLNWTLLNKEKSVVKLYPHVVTKSLMRNCPPPPPFQFVNIKEVTKSICPFAPSFSLQYILGTLVRKCSSERSVLLHEHLLSSILFPSH